MNMCIWRLTGVSLLALSISAQVLADDNNQQQQQQQQQRNDQQRQQHGFDLQRQQQNQNQQRSFNEDQQRQQSQQQDRQQQQQQQQQNQQQRQQDQLQQQRQQQQNQQDRFNQQRQQQERDRNQQNQAEQLQQRQLQDRQNNLPLQSRPDTVRQTEQPRQGFYRDQPSDNRWRGGNNRPDNGNWQAGRPGPGGHGDGWGSGPRYRPGYEIDRMPGGYSRVPYRGSDYFYSSGYWYRSQGPRYIVVEPPRGVRVRYLPDYAQQVWLGSSLFFLAAGTYYTYEQNTQEYVVAQPPQNVEPVYGPQPQQQQASPYDVAAYPANGQTQQQVEQDRYDCYRYAVEQSNFDPAGATYQPAPEVLGLYRQAMASCYASRGYSITQ